MVPQLVGYIDKAKDKQYEVRARNLLIAAQTTLDEMYAKEAAGATYQLTKDTANGNDVETDIITLAEEKSADVDIIEIATVGADGSGTEKSYKIASMEIDFKSGTPAKTVKHAEYSSATGTWTFTNP